MKNKYLKGLFAGSMIGMAAGMLLLPQVSNETRRKIINRGKSLLNSYQANNQEDEY